MFFRRNGKANDRLFLYPPEKHQIESGRVDDPVLLELMGQHVPEMRCRIRKQMSSRVAHYLLNHGESGRYYDDFRKKDILRPPYPKYDWIRYFDSVELPQGENYMVGIGKNNRVRSYCFPEMVVYELPSICSFTKSPRGSLEEPLKSWSHSNVFPLEISQAGVYLGEFEFVRGVVAGLKEAAETGKPFSFHKFAEGLDRYSAELHRVVDGKTLAVAALDQLCTRTSEPSRDPNPSAYRLAFGVLPDSRGILMFGDSKYLLLPRDKEGLEKFLEFLDNLRIELMRADVWKQLSLWQRFVNGEPLPPMEYGEHGGHVRDLMEMIQKKVLRAWQAGAPVAPFAPHLGYFAKRAVQEMERRRRAGRPGGRHDGDSDLFILAQANFLSLLMQQARPSLEGARPSPARLDHLIGEDAHQGASRAGGEEE